MAVVGIPLAIQNLASFLQHDSCQT